MPDSDAQVPTRVAGRAAWPLTESPYHYVPVMQDRSGELDATSHMRSSEWTQTTPLMVVVGPKDRRPVTRGVLDGRAKKLAAAMTQHPFYVDLLRINPGQRVAASTALGYLFSQLRRREAVFIPVVGLQDQRAARPEVAAAAATDARGAALRVRVDTVMASSESARTLAEATLEDLSVSPGDVDLLLDLDYLPPDAEVDIDTVLEIANDWVAAAPWRAAVLIGTSIPQTLGMINEGSIGGIPRKEWDVWEAAVAAGLALNYGDYVIQNPRPPEETGPGMRANIRYTTPTRTVVARGIGPVTQGIGSAQYASLAQQLWELPDFRTRDYSWGDEVIEECAQGLRPRSGQQLWRGVGSSHHIPVIVDQLGAAAAS